MNSPKKKKRINKPRLVAGDWQQLRKVIWKLIAKIEEAEKRSYQKGWGTGVNRGKTIAINTCMALGRLTGKSKGYYQALGEIITNLEI